MRSPAPRAADHGGAHAESTGLAAQTFVERLTDQQHRLDQLGHEDLSVRACFQASYQALDHGDHRDRTAAAAFRFLGLPDGPDISLPIAARLLDATDIETRTVLDRLVDAQLLENPTPGRYRMHDLLRLYARELAQQHIAQPERYAALERTWRCYLATTASASYLLRPGFRTDLIEFDLDAAVPLVDQEQALTWLGDERPNLLAAGQHAAAAPGEYPMIAIQLACALFHYMHSNVGAQVHRGLGHFDTSVEQLRDVLGRVRELRDPVEESLALRHLGDCLLDLKRFPEALDCFARSLAMTRNSATATGTVWALAQSAEAHRQMGELRRAVDSSQEALTLSRRIGSQQEQAMALWRHGTALADLGEAERAEQCWREALPIFERLGAPEAAEIQHLLDAASTDHS